MLNALAEKRGWLHYSHRDYAVAIERLYIETVDKELVIYPISRRDYMPTSTTTLSPQGFQLHREAVLSLIQKFKKARNE